jgi:hypothetical protein
MPILRFVVTVERKADGGRFTVIFGPKLELVEPAGISAKVVAVAKGEHDSTGEFEFIGADIETRSKFW